MSNFADRFQGYTAQSVLGSEPLVCVNESTNVFDALTVLANSKISSVPVTDSEGSICGVFGASDVALLLVAKLDVLTGIPSQLVDLYTKTVGHCMNLSGRNEWVEVEASASLGELARVLTSNHRVFVVSKGKILGLVTQSRLVAFAADVAGEWLRPVGVAPRPVVSIGQASTALQALALIVQRQVLGLAVLDTEDRLVGAFAANDIMKLRFTEPHQLYEDLCRPLHECAVSPVCIQEGEALGRVLNIFSEMRLHRAFVLHNGRMIAIITLSDLITQLLA